MILIFHINGDVSSKNGNSPTDADIIKTTVKVGDFIICGTDGVFDNLFDEELLALSKSFQLPFVNIVNPERTKNFGIDNIVMKELEIC